MIKSWLDQLKDGFGATRDLMEDLESRKLMSATSDGGATAAPASASVALIDTSLPNYNALSQAVSDASHIVYYNGKTDTASKVLGKLAAWAAATQQQIHSVSILSHGAAGKFALGKDWITSDAVQKKAWQKLRNVLSDDASIYLFGCNVAANEKGRTLLNHLATISGADVYGSTDLTGGISKGGDWVLEASSTAAPVRSAMPVSAPKAALWDFSLAAGISVTPTSGLTTTEALGAATFDVVLLEAPTGTVTIPISSSNTAEGTVSAASLTFDALNWGTPQSVTVTGVNDAIDDGDQGFTIITGPATSTDVAYDTLDAADVSVTNQDDDTAGITVTPTSGLSTTEAAGTATFDVVLNSQPTGDVTITIATTDATEGAVSTNTLTFTPLNWNVAQQVTITGVDDAVDDGNVAYGITTNAATSGDANYNGMNPADVSVANTDNDTAGVTVTPTSGLNTTEAGGTATFTVVLNSEPTADVTINLASSDLTEGTISAAALTFTAGNWNVAQTVTITGTNDLIDDGNVGYTIGTSAAVSGDGSYSGMNPTDVSVSNTDDDSAGITVTPTSGLTTTEAGATQTFDVVLTAEPTGNVTINLASSDLTEGTVSVSSLTFTPGNWNVAQQVTITGVNDAIDDGNVGYTVTTAAATSTDAAYSNLNAADVSVTNTDNDTTGITVTPTSGLSTSEAGGAAQFTVVLDSEPTANVTVGVSSNDAGEGTVSTGTLTFTPLNWNAPQTVTVTGVNEFVDDGDKAYTVVTAAAASTDGTYNGFNASDVSLTNVDNDTAGINVTPTSGLVTTEAGGTATFNITLNSRPLNQVVIGISTGDATEGTASTSSISINPGQWNNTHTVTVTGVNDLIDDGNVAYSIITGAATSGDALYNGMNAADVAVSNTDNDTAGITVTPTGGHTTTEAGGTSNFSVVLDTQPTADVIIAIASSNAGEGTVSASSLTFTAANWNTPQIVTVTGVNDFVDDGNVAYSILTGAAASADGSYNGFDAADVSVSNTDNDTGGFTITPLGGLVTTEAGGTANFSVQLNSQPTADVTLGLSSSDLTEGSLSAGSLTFTAGNWNTPQVVTVTGVDDFADDGNIAYTITTAAATSGDAVYNGMNPADVSASNTDNDAAGVTVTPTSGLNTTEAGGAATFDVVLTSQPSANVTISITSNDLTEGTVSTSTLTFTSANWNVAQQVTVTGVNDDVDDDNIGYTIVTGAAASADGGYNGIAVADVGVTNADNDTAGITVTPPLTPTTTEAAGQASFDVVLNSQPTANVVINIATTDSTEGTTSVTSLTFTPANWNTPQTVTVTGVNDFVDDGDIAYSITTAPATSTDAKYSGLNAADVSLTNTDNDTAGITVTPTSGLTTTEANGTATFNVVLNSQPTADVTIAIASSDTAEGTVSTALLTFTTANWNVAQTVTVTGQNEFVDDGNVGYTITTAPAASGDAIYNNINAADVSVTNVDNDTAGITVTPAGGLTTGETGSQATFNVRLNSQPTGDVTIGVSSSNTAEGTVSTTLLTFTAANWNIDQPVTVTGVNDLVDDGDIAYSIVLAPAVSSDANYSNFDAADVSVTNTDNDSAGVTITPTSGLVTTEAGGPATFDVVLTSQPTGDVVINLTSSDLTEGTLSTSTLTFTSGNWNVAQQVTVTGVDDSVDDGTVGYTIVTAAATSSDTVYHGLNPSDVSVSNTNDDTAAITVSPTSGLTTVEAGSEVTFTVVLDTQPTANVTIGINTGDATEGTVSTSLLTFTPANWNVPQTVTVSSVDDALVDGNITYSIITAAATSADPKYGGMNPSNVTVTNRDNDPNGVRLGGEFRVNTTTGNSQAFFGETNDSIATDANGNFVVVWSSFSQDAGGTWGIYAQRYAADGTALGGQFRVNTTTGGDQQYHAVAMDAAGNFVVTWSSAGQDGSGWGVYAQRYDAAGVAQGGEFRVNSTTGGDQMHPNIGMDAAGNFTVVWGSNGQDGSGWGVYGQRFNAAGVAQGGEFRANVNANGNQHQAYVGMSANGSFVVAWADSDGGYEIYARRYNAAGVAQGGAFRVNSETFKEQNDPSVGMDDAGNFVVTWASQHQDSGGNRYGIYAQRYTAAGAAVGGEFRVNTFTGGNQRYSSVAMDGDGDFVVIWSSDSRDGSGTGIFGQQYQSNGIARGGEFRVNSYATNDQNFPSIAMDASGDYTVVWTSDGQDGSLGGIYGQRYEGGNDAPINSVPGAQSVNEDGTLVFSTANGNLISIADSDVYANTVRVTLTAANGLLTLNSLTGLSFTTGDGSGDATMTFTGTVADINTALHGMAFAPNANYNGPASVQITTDDLGNSGWDGPMSDTDTVNVTVNAVNDAPANTVPGAQVTGEDTPLVFSTANGNRISVSDIDVASGNLRVTLTATNGTITLAGIAGLTFTTGDGTGDPTMTFSGTVAALNTALDGLTFNPTADHTGAASLQITTNDLGNSGAGGAASDADAIAIAVNPLNDAPVNNVPGAQATNEDTPLVFSTANGNLVSISDLDAGTNAVRVTLTVTNGLLTLSGTAGLTFSTGDGAADSTMTFTGTLTDINNALDGMSFAPTANYNGAASLQITTNDQGNSGAGGAASDADSVAITVNAINDPPVNTVPAPQSVNEDGTLVFSTANGNRISVADLDVAGGTVRVTLLASNGMLTLAGTTGLSFITGDGSGDATMTFTGTLADVNAALDGLAFAPAANFNGAASVQITTNDLGSVGAGGALSDTDSVAVTVNPVNDAPVLNGVNSVPAIDEDDVTNSGMLVSALVAGQITDLDAAAVFGIAVTAVDNTNGTWQYTTDGSTWLNFGSPTAGSARLLAADANTRVRFVPNSNYNGTATFAFRAWDQSAGAAGGTGNVTVSGGTTPFSTATATPVLTVNAVNDAPVNTVPGAQSVNEDGTLVFSTANGNAIVIGDVDHLGGNLRVTLTATNGLLTLGTTAGLGFTVGDGSSDVTMTFSGTLAAINAALDGLRYAPSLHYNGPATVTIGTSDLGNSGSGGAQVDSDTVNVAVNAVNDVPVNTVPPAQAIDEDGTLVFSSGNGNAISVSDLDLLAGQLRVTLTAANGRLTLSQLTGLSFVTGDGAGDATMTFTGTIADINAALNGLVFAPDAHFNGTASVQIITEDQGNTGSGGNLTDTDSVAITVNPINDAPAISGPAADATDEDTPLVFSIGNGNAIQISDVDAAGGLLQVVLGVTNGTLTLSGTTGLSFLAGDGTGDATMTFAGTLADINAALNGLVFSPALNYNGPATLSVSVNDQANSGAGGPLTDAHVVALTINAVNDAPVNGVPGPQNVDEDGVLVFSSGTGNAITISDLDLFAGTARVTLAATNGLLTLGDVTGLTFITGDGAADGTMTFTGTIADINAALDGLTFAPNADYNGPATITITTNDLGGTGLGGAQGDSDVVNVTVDPTNDAPIITAPPPQTVDEDTDLVFSSGNGNAISIGDIDAASGIIRLTLTAANGTITLGSLTGLTFVTGDGAADATMTFTGTLADINNALHGMSFRGNLHFNGAAAVQIDVDDQGSTGSGGALTDSRTVDITVDPVNDAPVHVAPASQATSEDTPLVFSTANGNAIVVSDVDVAGDLLHVTLTATGGTLTLSRLTGLSFATGDGAGDGTMTFTGTLAAINAALDGLTFNPNADHNGTDAVQITTSDLGNHGSGGALTASSTIVLDVNAVNDAPILVLPGGAQVTDEDTSHVFSTANGNAISVIDVDSGSGQVTLELTATNGTITLGSLAGLNFLIGDGAADTVMRFRGSVAEINAALEGLTFNPAADYNGPASISMTLDDQGNSGAGGAHTDSDVLPITVTPVNDGPVNTVPPDQATDEDAPLVFSGGNGNLISIADVDVAGGLMRVTLSASNGRLTLASLAGLAFSDGDGSNDATMTFTGTLADINNALDGLAFAPNAHYFGPASVSILTNDLGNNGTGGPLTDTDVVGITVNPVNDTPVNNVPAAQATNEDTVLVFSAANGNAISVADLDAMASDLLEVTLSATNGRLTLAGLSGLTFSVGDGIGNTTMTFTGTIADINAALNGLAFAPDTNFNGVAHVQITTDDQGHNGAGGPLVATDSVAIVVNPINDAPVNTVPAAQVTDEDTPLVFSAADGNQIRIDDIDAGNVRVTLSVSNGTLTLAGLTGLTFTAGDGTGDATMVFTGSPTDINAALDGLIYNPAANFYGAANLSITTNDLGNAGAGGAKSDTDSVAIAVNPVNDAPTHTVPGTLQHVNEDGTLVFATANNNRIAIADVDAFTSGVRVTLSVTHGRLWLGSVAGLTFATGDGSDNATMTFTGTLAAVNAALQGMAFRPQHDYAGPAQLTVTSDDLGNSGQGGPQSATSAVDLYVDPVNDVPVVTTSGGAVIYTENGAPLAVDPNVSILDVDDSTMAGATVAIVGYVPGQDALGFVDQNGITGAWDAQSGVLTLIGVASIADYEAALRSVTYANSSDNPAASTRTVQFVVGDGKLHNAPAGRDVVVVPVNDAPAATPLVVTLKEDAGRSTVDLWRLFSDIDNERNEISLTIVSSSNPGLFSGTSIDPVTGQLIIDSSRDAFGNAILTLRAVDQSGGTSETTLTVNVSPVNDAPVVTIDADPNPFDNTKASVTIDPQLVLSDVDSPTLSGATVRIENHVVGRDLLVFAGQNGIAGTYDDATGTLTLSGTATVAQYQQALRSVEYQTLGAVTSGGGQEIEFSVSDGSAVSTVSGRTIQFPLIETTTPPPVKHDPPPPDEPPVQPDTRPPVEPDAEPVVTLPPPVSEIPTSGGDAPPPPVAKPVAPPFVPPPVPPPVMPPEPVAVVEPAPDPTPTPTPVAVVPEPPPPPLPDPVIEVPPIAKPAALHTEKLWQQLDELARDLDEQAAKPKISIGSVAGLSTTLLSVGYVIWCLRGGSLVAMLLTTLPLWRWLDPLPVLDTHEEERRRREGKDGQNDEDEERIRTMMD